MRTTSRTPLRVRFADCEFGIVRSGFHPDEEDAITFRRRLRRELRRVQVFGGGSFYLVKVEWGE
jgi:hypothetical protein